jgi:hypothetical protein
MNSASHQAASHPQQAHSCQRGEGRGRLSGKLHRITSRVRRREGASVVQEEGIRGEGRSRQPGKQPPKASATSLLMRRKWAYEVKGVPANQAKILFAENNFWGRTLAAVSSSTDPSAYNNYGPFMPGARAQPVRLFSS